MSYVIRVYQVPGTSHALTGRNLQFAACTRRPRRAAHSAGLAALGRDDIKVVGNSRHADLKTHLT